MSGNRMLSSASEINAMRRNPSLANRLLCLEVMGGDCARNQLAVTMICGFRADSEIVARLEYQGLTEPSNRLCRQ